MNYKRIFALLSLTSLLISCGEASLSYDRYEKSEDDTHFLVVSDTHTFNPCLLNPEYDYDGNGSLRDGRTVNYNSELFDLVIETAAKKKVDYFIITGDLTHNGAKLSHEFVASKLGELKDKGVTPLVIPGNHDINICNSMDYSTNSAVPTPSVSDKEFRSIYKDCGFSSSKYRSPNGLSYIVETKNSEWLLMLDSVRYKENSDYQNVVGGRFDDIDWLREKLEEAKEKNIHCIGFSHHNLITHNEYFDSDYTIENAGDLLSLYKEYGVDTHFSGHLHIQNISTSDSVSDIATGSLLNYGNRFGEVYLTSSGLEYESHSLDFNIDKFNKFSDYSYSLFIKTHLREDSDQGKFSAKLNALYFDGSLYKNQDMKNSKYFSSFSKGTYAESVLKAFDIDHHFLQKRWN